MILSEETLKVLQNFQTINPSIVIEEGNVIRTVSPTESVYAEARVPDSFPKKFGIYDLSKFLGILSLSKQSDLTFSDDQSLTVVQGKSRIKYSFCDTSLIKTIDKNKTLKIENPYMTFVLEYTVLQQILKAMSILGFTEIAFRGKDGKLDAVALNTKNVSENTFATELGTTSKTFLCVLEAEKLKLLPNDYSVRISERGAALFSTDTVKYGITLSMKSEFE